MVNLNQMTVNVNRDVILYECLILYWNFLSEDLEEAFLAPNFSPANKNFTIFKC